jgi:cell division protein FtsB
VEGEGARMPPARHARARSRPAPPPRARPRPRAIAGGARAIRWDRVGRVALLIVLFGVVSLYVGPSIHLVETWQEGKQRRAQAAELRRENQALRARRRALHDPRTLEREARRLGLVKPGERPYIVRGLPRD